MGFCDSSQSNNSTPVWADPLGPTSTGKGGKAIYGATGAPQFRQGVFNYLSGAQPQMYGAAQTAATGYQNAAQNPFWGRAADYASRTLAGDYLNGSPELDRAMAANTSRAMAGAADEEARLKSEFGKNGMGFSTGYTQAAQANKAAAAADASRTNAATYLANYQAERANQNAAPSMMTAAQATPLNYLSQVAPTLMNPASGQGNILSALSSGGQVITPHSSQVLNPSIGSNIVNGWAGVIGNL